MIYLFIDVFIYFIIYKISYIIYHTSLFNKLLFKYLLFIDNIY
jgi:hypothetical protein